ncbi:MAG: SRPBCC family protein [Deltaproteobacteria bacterium]|nr:SRPBCC family protein [Deltaproteobacteria bacterium]
MSVLRKILLLVIIVMALLIVGGFFLPSEYSMQRSTVINAPIDRVYNLVADLSRNETWSPWKAKDPTVEITLGEQTSGPGASYTWVSENSGKGRLTITELIPNYSIKTSLDFMDQGTQAEGLWQFEPSPEGIHVTWMMKGDVGRNIVGRYFGLVMDMMAGRDFEMGLANLKEIAEKQSPGTE